MFLVQRIIESQFLEKQVADVPFIVQAIKLRVPRVFTLTHKFITHATFMRKNLFIATKYKV